MSTHSSPSWTTLSGKTVSPPEGGDTVLPLFTGPFRSTAQGPFSGLRPILGETTVLCRLGDAPRTARFSSR